MNTKQSTYRSLYAKQYKHANTKELLPKSSYIISSSRMQQVIALIYGVWTRQFETQW